MPDGTAPNRTTEGSRPGRPGRPRGSKTKPKGIIGRALAVKLLEHMEEQLAPDQFEYLKGVVKEGKPIETKNELDTLIALVGRSLIPALVKEMLPAEEGGGDGKFDRNINDRLKSFKDMLALRHQIEKNDSPDDDKNDTILTLTAKRGINLDRIGILINSSADSVGGSPDTIRGEANTIRALPDKLSERPLPVSSGEQGKTDRVLNRPEHRNITFSSDSDQA